ncbi:MAG: hypothetical protein ABIW32_07320, partial [Terrimesophilobacter sp.]
MVTARQKFEVVKRACALIGFGILALSLSACGGIPNSGSVNAGEPFIGEQLGDLIFNPLDPVAGADQRAILDGFMAAFTGPQGDYAVARKFLSASFKKDWDP